MHLAFYNHRIDDGAAIVHGYDPAQANHARFYVDFDNRNMRALGKGKSLRLPFGAISQFANRGGNFP